MKISRKNKITLLEEFGKIKQPFIQSFIIVYDKKEFESFSLISPHDVYKYLYNSMRTPSDRFCSNRQWWKSLNCFGYYYYRYTKTELRITLVIYSTSLIFKEDIAMRIKPLIDFKYVEAVYPDLEIDETLLSAINTLNQFSGVELFGIKNLKISK